LALSRALLGKTLYSCIDGRLTGGTIVETEAYQGAEDKACHAYNMRRTPRTEIMYSNGGVSYVYLCYGIHYLLNIVTHCEGNPHAILIRAIEPKVGIDVMLERRKKEKVERSLTAGPGALTQAMGITLKHNGLSLNSSTLWIEENSISISEKDILASPRVGVSYAEEHALLPWRFRLAPSQWTSIAK